MFADSSPWTAWLQRLQLDAVADGAVAGESGHFHAGVEAAKLVVREVDVVGNEAFHVPRLPGPVDAVEARGRLRAGKLKFARWGPLPCRFGGSASGTFVRNPP